MAITRFFLSCILLLGPLVSWAQEGEVGEVYSNDEARKLDPWEPMNRKIFAFNEGLDDYILRPVATGYSAVTPDPVEAGVTNFISNIYEFNTIINSTLQGRFDNAFDSLGRLIINSTVGLLGVFDVASAIGVPHKRADFGQTLHTWGVGSGPYLMMPVLGPRTVRSGLGQFADGFASIPSLYTDTLVNYTFRGGEAIDIRAQLLKADQLISGDRYIFLRTAYMQRRAALLNDGVIEDTFSDFEEGEEFEDF